MKVDSGSTEKKHKMFSLYCLSFYLSKDALMKRTRPGYDFCQSRSHVYKQCCPGKGFFIVLYCTDFLTLFHLLTAVCSCTLWTNPSKTELCSCKDSATKQGQNIPIGDNTDFFVSTIRAPSLPLSCFFFSLCSQRCPACASWREGERWSQMRREVVFQLRTIKTCI